MTLNHCMVFREFFWHTKDLTIDHEVEAGEFKPFVLYRVSICCLFCNNVMPATLTGRGIMAEVVTQIVLTGFSCKSSLV